MRSEFRALLLQAKSPRALSEMIYQFRSPVEGIHKIDFLCRRRTVLWFGK